MVGNDPIPQLRDWAVGETRVRAGESGGLAYESAPGWAKSEVWLMVEARHSLGYGMWDVGDEKGENTHSLAVVAGHSPVLATELPPRSMGLG
jgi:hypothetical protein